MIYDNFSEISDRFDTLLFDAYGVFWGGAAPIPGSLETMADQVRQGKPLCIVSNTSSVGQHTVDDYIRKGVIRGIHYTDVITSGDVCLDYIRRRLLNVPGPHVYIIGLSKVDLESAGYVRVSSPEQADFIFFGAPQFTTEQRAKYPDNHPDFLMCFGGTKYDLLSVEPFIPILEKCRDLNLPAVSTNPDLVALEQHVNRPCPDWIIRQGTFSETYRRMGGRVQEFGKPYPEIYRFVFERLHVRPTLRIAMVGDTFRTDIRGALDAGITPVWCIETGMAQYEMNRGRNLMTQAGGSLKGITLIRHL